MPQITRDDLELRRNSVRGSLNEITNDIAMEMRDAGLASIPVYLVIPNSGEAIATVATPLDPSDDDWSRVMDIVCRVVQGKIGSGKLWNRGLACTAINAPLTSADVVPA